MKNLFKREIVYLLLNNLCQLLSVQEENVYKIKILNGIYKKECHLPYIHVVRTVILILLREQIKRKILKSVMI
jgi:hypothetical protein